jgi:hypothetical protein
MSSATVLPVPQSLVIMANVIRHLDFYINRALARVFIA